MKARVPDPAPSWWPWVWATKSRSGIGIWPVVGRTAATPPTADVPSLAGRERVLARDQAAQVVGTDLAVYHRGESGWLRLGWEQIERADWDEQRGLVLIGWDRDLPLATLPLPAHSPLTTLARERIRSTTLLSSRVDLAELGGARVTVRRDPGNGALLWVVRPYPGVDATDPRFDARIDAAIARLSREVGLAGNEQGPLIAEFLGSTE